MAESRLIGGYPVIGIRPCIDGRRGPLKVRESLEVQTMNMAKAAAELFRNNLKYSNGEPVEVVIADTTIGRVAEAAACAEKFKKCGVDITLSVTPCWCYGSETMDMDPLTIKGVWGFNGTERPGAVYLAAVLAGHTQKGLPAFGIYGKDVQDMTDTSIPEDVKEKLLRFGSMIGDRKEIVSMSSIISTNGCWSFFTIRTARMDMKISSKRNFSLHIVRKTVNRKRKQALIQALFIHVDKMFALSLQSNIKNKTTVFIRYNCTRLSSASFGICRRIRLVYLKYVDRIFRTDFKFCMIAERLYGNRIGYVRKNDLGINVVTM